MGIFKRRPNALERLRATGLIEEAMGRVQSIPPGSRIFTSWSPKVAVAHVKSAAPGRGSVCEALSERTEWLGTGSDEERAHAASLRLCHRCQMGDYGEAAS